MRQETEREGFDRALGRPADVDGYAAFYSLVESFGDAIANLFEQMNRGNWVDDHGNFVSMNREMLALQPIMRKAMDARTKYAAPSAPEVES